MRLSPPLGGCCYSSWTCTSGSSRRWRKHVLEDFVWQRSLSWFMTFAGGVKASPVTERLKVSIRESHMSSENRVCGCSGQYQRMQRGFLHCSHGSRWNLPIFYPKRRWWVFFAQRSSLESRWLYILEDSNSTWIFIVSRLQNRKQRWGGIANTKAKWVKWKKKWVVFFHDFRLQQKRSLLWQDRGGQISCRFGRAKDLFFGSFNFRIMVGPERKLKMITQVTTSKHRSWMHLTYGFLRTSLVQHCLARLQPFSIEGRVCKECPAKWLGGLNIRPKGPNVMLIKLLFRDVSLRTFTKNVLLHGDDLHLKRLSWIEMPANSRKVEISRQPAVWNSAKFHERWESWCCDIKLVFWIFCEKMLPVLSTWVFCP